MYYYEIMNEPSNCVGHCLYQFFLDIDMDFFAEVYEALSPSLSWQNGSRLPKTFIVYDGLFHVLHQFRYSQKVCDMGDIFSVHSSIEILRTNQMNKLSNFVHETQIFLLFFAELWSNDGLADAALRVPRRHHRRRGQPRGGSGARGGGGGGGVKRQRRHVPSPSGAGAGADVRGLAGRAAHQQFVSNPNNEICIFSESLPQLGGRLAVSSANQTVQTSLKKFQNIVLCSYFVSGLKVAKFRTTSC